MNSSFFPILFTLFWHFRKHALDCKKLFRSIFFFCLLSFTIHWLYDYVSMQLYQLSALHTKFVINGRKFFQAAHAHHLHQRDCVWCGNFTYLSHGLMDVTNGKENSNIFFFSFIHTQSQPNIHPFNIFSTLKFVHRTHDFPPLWNGKFSSCTKQIQMQKHKYHWTMIKNRFFIWSHMS